MAKYCLKKLHKFLFLFFWLFFDNSYCQSLNNFVLKEAYVHEGGAYVLSSSGSPEDLIYNSDTILAKSQSGTYCSGFTFYLLFNALKENGWLEGYSKSDLKRMQKEWYGNTNASAETQCLFVIKKEKLGRKIEWEEAEPGDFVQFWRNNKSGHSVIFLGWERDSVGVISGLKYRSSQTTTNGIGDRLEAIGSGPKEISRYRLYIARLEKSEETFSENPFSDQKN
ncbi:MAG: hypothetical protein ACKO6A_04755 [Bacteroidota bacterium]